MRQHSENIMYASWNSLHLIITSVITASMEYNSSISPSISIQDYRLPLELEEKILHLLHLDDAKELEKQLTSFTHTKDESKDTGQVINEATYFGCYARRNLLHVASYIQARQCAHLLVSPPHSWNPDRMDRFNLTPLHLAELRDDVGMLILLAEYSTELRDMQLGALSSSVFGGYPSTTLVWPVDVWYEPITLRALVDIRSVGISGDPIDPICEYAYKTTMIGPLLALTFELYCSNPQLFAFNLWTGMTELDREHRPPGFWPIPVQDAIGAECVSHSNCRDYPHCLYLLGVEAKLQGNSSVETLHALRNRWIVHRFADRIADDGAQRLGVPTLAEVCRTHIRRWIVIRAVEQNIPTNYVKLLDELPIPQVLRPFLLFQDCWDVSGWEELLHNGHGGNLAYPLPLATKRTRHGIHGAGLTIGHRFIPEHST